MKKPTSKVCWRCRRGEHGLCRKMRRIPHNGLAPCECSCVKIESANNVAGEIAAG
jgi:hypothetical protein